MFFDNVYVALLIFFTSHFLLYIFLIKENLIYDIIAMLENVLYKCFILFFIKNHLLNIRN